MWTRKTQRLISPLIVALAGVLVTGSAALGVELLSSPQTQVSDEDLRAFTRASVEINQIRASYEIAVAKAAETLANQANDKIRDTLDKRDMTVGEYGRILQALERDPALRQKAGRIARDEAKKQGKQEIPPNLSPHEPAPPPNEPAPSPPEELPPPGELTSWQPRF